MMPRVKNIAVTDECPYASASKAADTLSAISRMRSGSGSDILWHYAFESLCDFLGKHHHLAEIGVGDVENIVCLLLWHHKRMAPVDRVDVEKRIKLVVLGDLVRRNLACNDF